jgi:hypothetical protein
VESYGSSPVIVYSPRNGQHGNFIDAAYSTIAARPEWMRRFDKIHAQGRSLPKSEDEPVRRWRELDSSMSSDALLMNIFCVPGVAESLAVRNALGVQADSAPVFGWKARVPMLNGRFDRTEVDMRWGDLLVEAKLTETDFQNCEQEVAEGYRDFDSVFERQQLPRVQLRSKRPRAATEFPEDYSQELESFVDVAGVRAMAPPGHDPRRELLEAQEWLRPDAGFASGYASYQLLRNVLAAYAEGCSFCVVHDERRPDLREAWFQVMAAVKSAALRVRLKVLTWQELAALLPDELQQFLDVKYGIAGPEKTFARAGVTELFQ